MRARWDYWSRGTAWDGGGWLRCSKKNRWAQDGGRAFEASAHVGWGRVSLPSVEKGLQYILCNDCDFFFVTVPLARHAMIPLLHTSLFISLCWELTDARIMILMSITMLPYPCTTFQQYHAECSSSIDLIIRGKLAQRHIKPVQEFSSRMLATLREHLGTDLSLTSMILDLADACQSTTVLLATSGLLPVTSQLLLPFTRAGIAE